ncbi:MAG: hypothetical protein LC792_00055 [Actinobacteria bacterium]|nr:hypothetical protein [Actinomycetota bacterium]
MKFEIAAADHDAAKVDQQYQMTTFELPAPDGEGSELYAAVRPVSAAFSAMLKDSYGVRSNPSQSLAIVARFLHTTMLEEDLREALIETGDYEPANDEDGDGVLSAAGLEIARSNERITERWTDRHDALGEATLAQVMVSLVEGWAGKGTGSQPASSRQSRRTGARSTRSASSKGSTRSKSTTAAQRRS